VEVAKLLDKTLLSYLESGIRLSVITASLPYVQDIL